MDDRDTSTHDSEMPTCWRRPWAAVECQGTLFPADACEAIDDLSVSMDELQRWIRRGWVQRMTLDGQPLEVGQVWELQLVCRLARSGLDDRVISRALAGLPRPICVPPELLAFSPEYGWVIPAAATDHDSDDEPTDKALAIIDELVETEDVQSLKRVKRVLEKAISELIACGE